MTEVPILICSGFEEQADSVVSFLVFAYSWIVDNRQISYGSCISENSVYRGSLLLEFGNNRVDVGSGNRSSTV